MTGKQGFRLLCLVVFLEFVHFLSRWLLLRSPFFSEVDYDQAVPSLMALHILKGDPQLMLWGQPRMGGLQAYLAAFVFHLFGPSAWSLHLSLLAVSAVMLLTVLAVGKKTGGQRVGVLSAAYWAVPPIFLSFNGLYAGGGHQEAVLLGTFSLIGAMTLSFRNRREQLLLTAWLGLLSGLGGWSSLLITPFVVAAILVVLGRQPKLLWSPLPLAGAAGLLIGSLPFWAWNYQHDFDTLIHLGGKSISPVFRHLWIVVSVGVQTLLGTFWDAQGVSARIPRPVVWGIGLGIYLPVLILSLFVVCLWLKRMIARKPLFSEPRDGVVLFLLVFLLIRATGETEDIGLTRYHLAWFFPVAVLTGWWLNRLLSRYKVLGPAAFLVLMGFNLSTQFLYMQEHRREPLHPLRTLIQALKQEGIRYVYGHNRVTQGLTFESGEKIIATDFFGTRNYAYLKTVDAAPSPETAFLTHRVLGNPYPKTLEAALQLLGLGYQKKEMGDYVFFYHFQPKAVHRRSIPAEEWQVKALRPEGRPRSIKDRDLLTSWQLRHPGEGVEIDLGRERHVAGLSIYSSPGDLRLSTRFKVEWSLTGNTWVPLAEVNDYLPGFILTRDGPRLHPFPVIQMIFPSIKGRYLRITHWSGDPGHPEPWEISELFIYEAAPLPSAQDARAIRNLACARALLEAWMEDPTGPHPLIPRLSMDFRKKKVDWVEVVHYLDQAMRALPDEEEAFLLFGQALSWGELASVPLPERKKEERSGRGAGRGEKEFVFTAKHWTATSSENLSAASLALDGDPETRWASGKAQEPGMFFQVDMGEKQRLAGFSLFLGPSLTDYPRDLQVLISADGRTWKEAGYRSSAHYAVRLGRLIKGVDFRLQPVNGRFLRLVQKGRDPEAWWSIYELDLSVRGTTDFPKGETGR